MLLNPYYSRGLRHILRVPRSFYVALAPKKPACNANRHTPINCWSDRISAGLPIFKADQSHSYLTTQREKGWLTQYHAAYIALHIKTDTKSGFSDLNEKTP